jgi:hypothetical protein
MYVHRRTLVAVADRFLGVGCSLKSSLIPPQQVLYNYIFRQIHIHLSMRYGTVRYGTERYGTVPTGFQKESSNTLKALLNKCTFTYTEASENTVLKPVFRIRFHWLLIRIQHFRLNTRYQFGSVPDPDPGVGKNYSWKKFDIFCLKIANYLSLGRNKGRPSYRRKNIKHFRTRNFLTFFYLWIIFASWIRIRIHWPDWIRIRNTAVNNRLYKPTDNL